MEYTIRTVQGRALLRPSAIVNETIAGILGACLAKHPSVVHHATAVLSNHMHGLYSVPSVKVQAEFQRDLNGQLAKAIGALVGWQDCRFWSARFHAQEILDVKKAAERLDYVLSQGCKEDLVDSPYEWPGVHSAKVLGRGVPMRGKRVDWSRYSDEVRKRNRRSNATKGLEIDVENFTSVYEVPHCPIPGFEHLSPEKYRAYCARRIQAITKMHQVRRQRDGKVVCGQQAIMRQQPHGVVGNLSKSPGSIVHTCFSSLRAAFLEAFDATMDAYDRAAANLKVGKQARFPRGMFPSRLPYVAEDRSMSGIVPGLDACCAFT